MGFYSRVCVHCKTPFTTDNARKKKCRDSCRPSTVRNAARVESNLANTPMEFIAVDGEGVNAVELVWETDFDPDTGEEFTRRVRKDVHHYVLLSVGDKSLHKDGEPLTHREIFPFLWEQFEANPNAAFVGYFLGYDFTFWLKSISPHEGWQLLHKEGIAARTRRDGLSPMPWSVKTDIKWGKNPETGKAFIVDAKWEIDILGNKRFRLRKFTPDADIPRDKNGAKEPRPWMYVCDVGPFYQAPFKATIDPSDPKKWPTGTVCTPEEFDIICNGKDGRGTQDLPFGPEMIEYNLLENQILARLMRRLDQGFREDGIILNRTKWMGPGQAAQAWMSLIGVPTGEQVREAVPVWARDAARKTYYGGWFEIFCHGPVPGVSFNYDINSAYPTIIAKLPCLLHGEWIKGLGKPSHHRADAIHMVYADVWGADEWIGPMPHRRKNGTILRPKRTRGWYWLHELQASERAGLVRRWKGIEHVTYLPCPCDPPMKAVEILYKGRLDAGKNSPQGIAKKLVYNSAYGKLAQSIGQPKFSNSIWASLITAGCRTMILDAIATHPKKSDAVLMIATDGIVFSEPHPTLEISGEELGKWDAETKENLSLFMPGVYWDDDSRIRIRAGQAPKKLKSRGVSSKHLATIIEQADILWGQVGGLTGPPVIPIYIDWGFIGAKQAAARGKWEQCGAVVTYVDDDGVTKVGAKRTISAHPDSKRCEMHWGEVNGEPVLRSRPYDKDDDRAETHYYMRGFGETIESLIGDMLDEFDEMVTPQGPAGMVRRWEMKGEVI